MTRKEVLQQLNLGNSVAEFDDDLQSYFVETETFRSLIYGNKDIVSGDKGTGKSAIFRILQQRYVEIPELNRVRVVPAFNTSGSPVFQQLAEGGTAVLTEAQYRTVWKTYILSLGGNWLLKRYKGKWTRSMKRLDALLKRVDVRDNDDTPNGIFSHLVALVKRLTTPRFIGVESAFDEAGLPVVTSKIEFGEPDQPQAEREIIRHSESLGLLNHALAEAEISLWLVLDRLDEAFAGYPAIEIPALRALFRTYLDLQEFDRIKLKMFVRRDLFRRVTKGEEGFVNLTHIDAKKVEIVWDDDDLLNLLIRRVRTNDNFVESTRLEGKTNRRIFNEVFPVQVEEGARRPKTLAWMLSRIRDGQDVKSPRNLIDLVKTAQQEQLRREDREPHEYNPGDPLFDPEAIRDAQTRLSKRRVDDTLLAESGKYRVLIEKFRSGKAEHNVTSLMKTLDLPDKETQDVLKILLDMGFLERVRKSETYKIPMLYRDGLDITQGKAFRSPDESGDDAKQAK